MKETDITLKEVTDINNVEVDSKYLVHGIVKSIEKDGDKATSKPIVLLFQIEGSKQTFKVTTWDYSALETFRSVQKDRFICDITIQTSLYNGNMSYKLYGFTNTNIVTTIPEVVTDIEATRIQYKKSIAEIINAVSNEAYKKILVELILNNENFFKWKAALSVHHSFEGGLALHTINVYNNAINIANTYNGDREFTIDYDLITTGALLHDIGKLKELTVDGEYCLYGKFLTHLVIGIEMIDDACLKLNLDKESQDILLLKHIIASHHRKLEYGATIVPIIPEAIIVSTADHNDAECESMIENLLNTDTGKETTRMKGLDDLKLIKMY